MEPPQPPFQAKHLSWAQWQVLCWYAIRLRLPGLASSGRRCSHGCDQANFTSPQAPQLENGACTATAMMGTTPPTQYRPSDSG
ncbi:hypothetical protein NDU88_004420 [Pleurodeles waltl]|uniref:Uncharacterized protein n=1 Tax=Pleurodeles waltl TaxID=8319 RepID=A0AAV7MBN3_PLEWA|nr:hypothetical protein NDU88_004420 [Pleurodeles waltl]